MRKYLNVAEKPSAAKQIAAILSRGSSRTIASRSKFNPVYEFKYRLRGQEVIMHFTSVTGHIVGLAFEEKYSMKYWNSAPHEELFKVARVQKQVDPEKQALVQNLHNLSRDAFGLILWLDCDREGEAIAFEVMRLCQEVKPNLEILRAHFSAFTDRDITNAMNTLRDPDPNLADAVESRQEIDLRIGAAFTRYQTTLLKKRIPALSATKVISYGPCQFPTLGFVVERWKKVQAFVPEPFWYIYCRHEKVSKVGTRETVEFKWDRNHLFDQDCASVLYDKCFENPEATVLSITGNLKQRYRPYPLSTVAMQKLSTSKLRLASHRTMEIAEKLYNKGFISYPRTETDFFSNTINVRGLVDVQRQHPDWGDYADNLLDGGGFQWPKQGKHDDKAHPPIHPVRLATKDGSGLNIDEWRVYELVSRHFLACCSKDANGFETTIRVEIAGEFFHAKGLLIKEYNYLEVYPFDKWTGNTLPDFEEYEKFTPTELRLKESRTTPPTLLTEPELITLMDQQGIGTDATIHEHIKTIQERQYADKQGQYFTPTKLGLALVDAYEATGTDLWKPLLRASMEANMTEISKGKMRKEVFLDGCLEEMKNIFVQMKQREQAILEVMKGHFDGVNFDPTSMNNANAELSGIDPSELKAINDEEGTCGNCNNRSLQLMEGPGGVKLVFCSTEGRMLKLPFKGEANFKDFICPLCSFQTVDIRSENSTYNVCAWCYTNPPADLFPNPDEVIGTMPCFKCPNTACSLASRGGATEKPIFNCPACQNNPMIFKKSKNGKKFLGCKGYPSCNYIINIPEIIKDVHVTQEDCTRCGSGVKKAKIMFGQDSLLPPNINARVIEDESIFCFGGCDADLESLGYDPETNNNRNRSVTRSPDGGRNSFSNSNGMNSNSVSQNQPTNGVKSFLDKYSNKQPSMTQQQTGMRQDFAKGPTFQPATQAPPSTALGRMGGNGNVNQGQSPNKMEFCSKCKKVGHNVSNCPLLNSNSRGNLQGTESIRLQPALQAQQNSLTNHNSNSMNSMARNPSPMNQLPREPSTTANNDKSNPTCYKCKEKGHYSNKCPGILQLKGSADGDFDEEPAETTSRSYTSYKNHTSTNNNAGGNYNSNYNKDNSKSNFNQTGGQKSGECYICHESGHWANQCPQKGQNPRNQAGGYGARGGGGGGGGNGGSGGSGGQQRNYTTSSNTGASGGGDYLANVKCFKCQQNGHYANSCPQAQGNSGNQGGYQRNQDEYQGYQGNEGGRSYTSYQENNYNKPNNKSKAGGGNNLSLNTGNQKVCHVCGHSGKHPRGSTCPTIKRKKTKTGNDQGGDYDGGEDY